MFIIVFLLLFSAALLGFATYAWLVLSTRPTVESVSLNVGANGGLEVALLTNSTYENTDRIETSVGDSINILPLAQANSTWGNVIDLSDESYGMDKMKLTPSVLNVKSAYDGTVTVGKSILLSPSFGLDGRLTLIDAQSVSATYTGSGFYCSEAGEAHGVRAIGTANNASEQMKALSIARTSVATDQTLARQTASVALGDNGSILFDAYYRHARNASAVYTDEDVTRLKELAKETEKALSYLDDALRYSVVAFAASEVSGTAQFSAVSEMLLNTNTPLSETLGLLSVTLPASPVDEASEIQVAIDSVHTAYEACKELSGDRYIWKDIKPIIERFVNIDRTYYNEKVFDASTTPENGSEITMLPDSGAYGVIADYVGEFSAYTQDWSDTESEIEVELIARSGRKTPRMKTFVSSISVLAPADGSVATDVELQDVIGYAIDLAFRTNASNANLLLQTTPAQRILDESNSYFFQGGGSYLETYSSQLSKDKIIDLVDAIRISFLDGSGTLLAMAKLNTSNYETWNEGYRFPLYLYDYSLQLGNVTMGERRSEDSKITPLPRGVPVIVSAVVWLDGSRVSNSLSSYFSDSISSTLNLQFSTDVPLRPADNSSLHQTDVLLTDPSSSVLATLTRLNEVNGADEVTQISVYANDAEAKQDGAELSEKYYVIARNGLSCMRVYVSEDGSEFIVTGYAADKLTLPSDSSNLFAGMTSLETIRNADLLLTSAVRDMSGLFSGCESLVQLDLSSWDIDQVESFSEMFADCPADAEIVVPSRIKDEEAICRYDGMFNVVLN